MTDTFSQHEVAAMFGVQPATVRRWWGAGLLPAPFKTPGGTFRWLKSDIVEFIERNRAEAPGKEVEKCV